MASLGSTVVDSEEDLRKKRAREEEDKKNRGNYRCSRCNLPKKGHVCPYQPKFKRRETASDSTADASVQAELDGDMTVRCLVLQDQGLLSSYMPLVNSKVRNWESSIRETVYSDDLINALMHSDKSNPPFEVDNPMSEVKLSMSEPNTNP